MNTTPNTYHVPGGVPVGELYQNGPASLALVNAKERARNARLRAATNREVAAITTQKVTKGKINTAQKGAC